MPILLLGWVLLPLYSRITRKPPVVLFPVIASLAIVASFTFQRTTFAMYVAVGIGVFGYVLRTFGYPVIPLLLGLILGPMLESNFRRALILSEGDPLVLVSSPISAGLLLVAVLFPFLVSFSANRANGVGSLGVRGRTAVPVCGLQSPSRRIVPVCSTTTGKPWNVRGILLAAAPSF